MKPGHVGGLECAVSVKAANCVLITDHRLAWGEDDFELQQNRANFCRGIKRQLRE